MKTQSYYLSGVAGSCTGAGTRAILVDIETTVEKDKEFATNDWQKVLENVAELQSFLKAKPDGFQEKYLDMLRSGGVKRHKELLAPFGLDASDPQFWNGGLSVIAGFIDELEALG